MDTIRYRRSAPFTLVSYPKSALLRAVAYNDTFILSDEMSAVSTVTHTSIEVTNVLFTTTLDYVRGSKGSDRNK